jgi:hypothetical protein
MMKMGFPLVLDFLSLDCVNRIINLLDDKSIFDGPGSWGRCKIGRSGALMGDKCLCSTASALQDMT